MLAHAAILAGGSSRRMGRDKASLPWQQGTLLGHVVQICHSVGLKTWQLGGMPQPLCHYIPDRLPGQGPLPALCDLLARLRQPLILLSCDRPHFNSTLLFHLIDQFRGQPLAVVVQGHADPTLSIYTPTQLAQAQALCATSSKALFPLLHNVQHYALPSALCSAATDCDTPEQYFQAQLAPRSSP